MQVKVQRDWFWRGGFLSPGIEYEMTAEDVQTLRNVGAPLIEKVEVHETESRSKRGRNKRGG